MREFAIPSLLSAPALLVALAAGASAQQAFVFDIDQASSDWVWSGTTSIGSLLGDPGNDFQLSGTCTIDIAPGAQPMATGQITAGNSPVIPDLRGRVPNPIPGFPDLAKIQIDGLVLSYSSPSFTIDGNGDFGTTWTSTVLAGTLTVIPLVGQTTMTDLTGEVGTPGPFNGTLTEVGGDVDLDAPGQTSQFQFTDPASGITGDITIQGDLYATWTCPAPQVYCTAKVNSQGCLPVISATGAASYSDPAPFDVAADEMLSSKPGLFFYGYEPFALPFQDGFLCVKPPVKRMAPQNSGGNYPPTDCSGSYAVDFNATIQGGGDVNLVPGKQVFVQCWARDPQAASGTNLTDALSFTICP